MLAACEQSASAIAPVSDRIKTALHRSPVVHNDETGFRIEKKRWWLHVAATCWFTRTWPIPKRGKSRRPMRWKSLPTFQGTSVHDSLSSYFHYGCIHALCVVHYLRELTFVFERFEQTLGQRNESVALGNQSVCSTGTRGGNGQLTRSDQAGL